MLEEAQEPIGTEEGRSPPRRRWSEAERPRIMAESYQPMFLYRLWRGATT